MKKMRTALISALLFIVSHVHGLKTHAPALLWHEGCASKFGEGMGRDLWQLRSFADVAVRYDMRMVCDPGDYKSNGHGLGYFGFLFGCNSDSSVLGNLVSLKELNKTMPNWRDEKIPVSLVNPDTPQITLNFGEAKPKHNRIYFVPKEHGCFMSEGPDGKPVHNHGFPQGNSWGEGWRWFRSQYAHALAADPARKQTCWSSTEPGKTRVAIHLRRGDDYWRKGGESARDYGVVTYIDILKRSLVGDVAGVPPNRMDNLVIQVIAETTFAREPSLKLFQSELPRAKIVYRLGDASLADASLADARARLVADMDCMQGSDLLLLSGKSTLSQLAAAVQKEGGRSVQMAGDDEGWMAGPSLPSLTTDKKHYRHLFRDELKEHPQNIVEPKLFLQLESWVEEQAR